MRKSRYAAAPLDPAAVALTGALALSGAAALGLHRRSSPSRAPLKIGVLNSSRRYSPHSATRTCRR
jgi:hypothetical protein